MEMAVTILGRTRPFIDNKGNVCFFVFFISPFKRSGQPPLPKFIHSSASTIDRQKKLYECIKNLRTLKFGLNLPAVKASDTDHAFFFSFFTKMNNYNIWKNITNNRIGLHIFIIPSLLNCHCYYQRMKITNSFHLPNAYSWCKRCTKMMLWQQSLCPICHTMLSFWLQDDLLNDYHVHFSSSSWRLFNCSAVSELFMQMPEHHWVVAQTACGTF